MSKINQYDSEFCGRVPLHQTNLIQPHGVLLIVQKSDFSILQASENAEVVFSLPVTELVKQKLSDFIAEDKISTLKSLFSAGSSGKLPFVFSVQQRSFLSIVEQHSLYYIIEIENEPHDAEKQTSFISIYQNLKLAIAAIETSNSTEQTCWIVAKELKKLSGFDKVMVYCFDENWNGDVVAEEMEEGMDSYLGLKFPASDIPKQARELYKKSPYRLIPTGTYHPVRLYPVLNPLTNAFTDLSNSNLRSVASVHLEYLQNMGVTASMSTRILKDNELWGLIACHHRTPKYLSFEMCSVFELLSNVITAKISAVQNEDRYQYIAAKQEFHRKIIEQVLSGEDIAKEKQNLLALLDADGVAIVRNHRIETAGLTPDQENIQDLIYWLQANTVTGIYHQPSLSSVYEAAEVYAEKVSGLLALPVEIEKGDFIFAFRSEAVQKISWGGNPAEAIQFEADGKRYHPRASFKIWQETVRKTSLPWKKETVELAEGLRNFLIESRLNKKY